MFIKVDFKFCTGCHLCEYACSSKKYGFFCEAKRIRIKSKILDGINEPVLCRQCNPPYCRDACEYGAISTTKEGIIQINDNLCVKCGECVKKCPFNAINFDSESRIVVCDLCDGKPECVAICPTGALTMEVSKNGC